MHKRILLRCNVRRGATALALASGLAVAGLASAQVQVLEDFNTDPSSRGWSGVNNRNSPQNYGWSGDDGTATGTITGGAGSTPGEMGGTLFRQNPAFNGGLDTFYGVDLGSIFFLPNNPFAVSGVINLQSWGGSSGFLLGYSKGVDSFSDGTDLGDAHNFIGMSFDDGYKVNGVLFNGTGGKQSDSNPPALLTVGNTHTFSMVFDPTEVNPNGKHGLLTIVVDSNALSMNLDDEAGAVDLLDHFGIMPISASGGADNVWLDNLSYTSPSGSGGQFSMWNHTSSGTFTDGANWTAGVPNGVDAVANFLSAFTAPHTVVIDDAVTVGTMRFSNSNTYNLGGLGSITLQTSSGSALVDVISGTQKINVPLTIASDTTLNVDSGATLKISDPLTVSAGKSLAPTGSGSVKYESTISVGSNASITFGNSSHAASLVLAGGARATLAPKSAAYLVQVDSLTVPSNARLDLGTNAAAVNYTGSSPIATIRSSVATAFAAGWNANGITSSSAAAAVSGAHPLGIGVVEASTLGIGSYLGESIDSTTVLARTTFNGDTNIDGTVNSSDFSQLAAHWGQTGKFWNDGDFNYDGKVNALDFNSIAMNYGQVLSAPLPADGLAAMSGTLVPEPVSCVVFPALATLMLASRRRNIFGRRNIGGNK